MESVLWPMEPVEPRMASFFTLPIFADLHSASRIDRVISVLCFAGKGFGRDIFELKAAHAEGVLEDEDKPEDGGGEEERVNAVEHASVAGEHGS